MKFVMVILLMTGSVVASEDVFKQEASTLANILKTSIMKELKENIAKEGHVKSIPFCHDNVKIIAKSAAKDYLKKYEFGRTSHKIRNTENSPAPWMKKYLNEFKGTKMDSHKDASVLHVLPSGKRVYMEPLYVQAQCLACHGPSLAKDLSSKIKELYPEDQATGFKLGEFRGFVWVKEK